MKILGIVAGRHGGNSEILVKEALVAASAKGAECKMINLFDYHIEHCTGCESCTMQMGEVAMDPTKKYRGCILKDKDDEVVTAVIGGAFYNLKSVSSHFKDKSGEFIDISAIIGGDFLKHYEAKINYKEKTLTLNIT